MPRYIDADLLWDKILRAYQFSDRRGVMGYVKQCLNEAPTADVEPVRHGKWEIKFNFLGEKYLECSNCGYDIIDNGILKHILKYDYKYCSHCGAKMDGGNDNDNT